MEFTLATNLSKKLQININNIVREYWEIFILNELANSPLAEKLIFKGGTALRLIYRSPRFSEDLDFSLLTKINFSVFKNVIEKAVNLQPELSLGEIFSKKNTFFALIKFKQDYLTQTFSIKVEISKRKVQLKQNKDFVSAVISSPTSNLKPLIKVLTLERIFKEKKSALISRSKPRDLFDFWFVGQLLRLSKITLPKIKMGEKEIKQELNRLLPKNYQTVIPQLIKYAQNK